MYHQLRNRPDLVIVAIMLNQLIEEQPLENDTSSFTVDCDHASALSDQATFTYVAPVLITVDVPQAKSPSTAVSGTVDSQGCRP